MSKISKEDYIGALKKLEKSKDDAVGIFGDIVILCACGAAGAVGAGAIATFFGATTIFGSSALASIAGGVFVTTTPIGWIAGTASAGVAVAYGATKLIKSGAISNERKKQIIHEIKQKIYEDKSFNSKNMTDIFYIKKIAGACAILLENDMMEQEDIEALMNNINEKRISTEASYDFIIELLNEMEQNSDSNDLLKAKESKQ
jgi:hypothetical protein